MAKLNESRFSLIIAGNDLDMDALSASLGLEPTKLIHKDDVLGRIPAPVVADKDQWMYSVNLVNEIEADEALNDLLTQLIARKDLIQELAARYTLTLRLFVRSDMARMVYNLAPATLANLCAIGLPLEISSISWGQLGI